MPPSELDEGWDEPSDLEAPPSGLDEGWPEPVDADVPTFAEALAELSAPEASLRTGLIEALSDPRPSDVADFRATWAELSSDRREWIVSRLVESSEASFQVRYERLFEALLDDDSAAIRAAAIDGLWEDEHPSLVRTFVGLLADDPSEDVRAHAAAALGEHVLRGELDELPPDLLELAVEALLSAAENEMEGDEVRRRALESVGYADRPAVRRLIREFFASPREDLRVSAVCAMGRSADGEWSGDVEESLEDVFPAVRYEAALAAGRLGLSDMVPQLMALAEADDRAIQEAAIWSLGEIGGAAARRALERLLRDAPDEDLEEAIEDALATAALSEGDLTFGMLD